MLAAPGGPSQTTPVGPIQLNFRLDYPNKQFQHTVDNTITFGELKKIAAEKLEIDEKTSNLSKYCFYAIQYGKDVQDLNSNITDSAAINTIPLYNSSTLLLVSPAEAKPAYSKRKLIHKKEEKGDEKKSVDVDRYHGITMLNIFSKLAETTNASKRKILFEYIEIYAAKLFVQPQALKWDEATILALVKSDSLNIEEAELFDFLLKWCSQGGKSAEEIKTTIKPFLQYIRFPTMTTQDLALKVAPSSLLDQQQILDLFTYLGLKQATPDKLPKLPESLKLFNANKRKGRKPPNWFKFDETKKHPNIVVSEEGTLLSSTTTSYYQTIWGDIELDKGVHEWTITLNQLYTNAYAVIIGVTPASYTAYTTAQMIGYSGHIPGWAFAVYHAQKYSSSGMVAYGRKAQQGEKIRVKLDCDAQTLEYFINDQSQGVAFTNIPMPVRPAVSLYGTNTVKLSF